MFSAFVLQQLLCERATMICYTDVAYRLPFFFLHFFHISLYFHSPTVDVKNSRPHVIQNPYNFLHSNCSLFPFSHEATLVKPTA